MCSLVIELVISFVWLTDTFTFDRFVAICCQCFTYKILYHQGYNSDVSSKHFAKYSLYLNLGKTLMMWHGAVI